MMRLNVVISLRSTPAVISRSNERRLADLKDNGERLGK